jgi:transposase
MEWRQGQAYSQDLRDRVLAAVDRGMPVYEAAPVFRVSVSYIYKALARRRETGENSARPQRSHTPPLLVDHHGVIERQVAERPDATLAELRAWLLAAHGVAVSQGCMWSTMKRLGLTRKKSRSARPSRTARTSPAPARSGGTARRS